MVFWIFCVDKFSAPIASYPMFCLQSMCVSYIQLYKTCFEQACQFYMFLFTLQISKFDPVSEKKICLSVCQFGIKCFSICKHRNLLFDVGSRASSELQTPHERWYCSSLLKENKCVNQCIHQHVNKMYRSLFQIRNFTFHIFLR